MQFSKVVVGVDFSAASLAAARWVATQLAPQAEIVLVHVLPAPDAPSCVRPYLPPMLDIAAGVAPALYGGLRGLANLLDPDHPDRVQIDMLTGAPAEGLALAGEAAGADLICVGRTRSRRGSARFGATTAQRLLARSRTPLLVVPGTRPTPPERVLVAVDDWPSAEHVVRESWRLAQAYEARVDALHVLAPELCHLVRASRHLDLDDGDRPTTLSSRADQQARARRPFDEEQAMRLTREWLVSLLDASDAAPTRAGAHVRSGDAGQEIVSFAHTARSDLVVVGRGGGCTSGELALPAPGCAALPLGSTARLVMWAAPCPALVLPGVPAEEPTPPGRHRGRLRDLRAPRTGVRAQLPASSGPLPPAAERHPPAPAREVA